jgi:hypothetical protein
MVSIRDVGSEEEGRTSTFDTYEERAKTAEGDRQ